MIRTMRTTTLIVDTPIDYDRLGRKFKLIRYTVPERFSFLKDKNKFSRLHVALKDQLNDPYRFFTHDAPTPLGIYVLYESNAEVLELQLNFLSGDENLPWTEAQFDQLPLHLLMKLLQANYFKSRRTTEFVSQSKYYIQAQVKRSEIVCLEIELKGDRKNIEVVEGEPQEFKIIGHATRFIKRNKDKIQEGYKKIYPYFYRMSPKGGQSFFTQLSPAEIDDYLGDIYGIWQDSSERATLDYHSQLKPEHTRGKILHDFTKNFIAYLTKYGISVRQKKREFSEYRPPRGNAELPIADLEMIYLYDNRLNQETIPFENYHSFLSSAYPHISFKKIAANISPSFSGPLLVLQDYNAEDFKPEGILAGFRDPYQQLYQSKAYRDIPKQSININPNQANECAGRKDYLTYPLLSFQDNKDQRFDIRFSVCFNQLYLKELIFNQRKIIGCLPCFLDVNQASASSGTLLQDYAFIRKKTHDRDSYHTLLYINNGKLAFADLRDPQDRQKLYKLLDKYDLDWDDDIIEPFNQKYLNPGREEKKIKRYDFIVGPGQVIEIEDMEERVLYDYDTILERRADLDNPYPIGALMLVPNYEEIRTQQMLSLAELSVQDQRDVSVAKQSKAYLASKAFQEQLQEYDEFLEALATNRTHISFNELTSGENMVRIGQIFDIKPNNQGKYNRGKFKRCYQRLGMFPSDKAADVQSYSGIWYDAENCFMVGSPQSLQDKQARAHLIRRFDSYKGGKLFDIDMFLETIGVKFVRYQQYTVYPYFFHLIDLYVETILRPAKQGG